ncbi:hypothetical protein SUNI508_12173 [Seiridium unicorne]|uniref:Uncharacterized protein n=1 Tax=Seiridium unicorne TaxID=138068 RepID=A0ABR2UES3_9PEZI
MASSAAAFQRYELIKTFDTDEINIELPVRATYRTCSVDQHHSKTDLNAGDPSEWEGSHGRRVSVDLVLRPIAFHPPLCCSNVTIGNEADAVSSVELSTDESSTLVDQAQGDSIGNLTAEQSLNVQIDERIAYDYFIHEDVPRPQIDQDNTQSNRSDRLSERHRSAFGIVTSLPIFFRPRFLRGVPSTDSNAFLLGSQPSKTEKALQAELRGSVDDHIDLASTADIVITPSIPHYQTPSQQPSILFGIEEYLELVSQSNRQKLGKKLQVTADDSPSVRLQKESGVARSLLERRGLAGKQISVVTNIPIGGHHIYNSSWLSSPESPPDDSESP